MKIQRFNNFINEGWRSDDPVLKVASAVVHAAHGWAVRDQFEKTFEDPSVESFSECNPNALNYIKQELIELLDSGVLNEEATDRLTEYLNSMEETLPKYDESEETEEPDAQY